MLLGKYEHRFVPSRGGSRALTLLLLQKEPPSWVLGLVGGKPLVSDRHLAQLNIQATSPALWFAILPVITLERLRVLAAPAFTIAL